MPIRGNGQYEDLEEAIHRAIQPLHLMPDSHLGLAGHLDNLSESLERRCKGATKRERMTSSFVEKVVLPCELLVDERRLLRVAKILSGRGHRFRNDLKKEFHSGIIQKVSKQSRQHLGIDNWWTCV